MYFEQFHPFFGQYCPVAIVAVSCLNIPCSAPSLFSALDATLSIHLSFDKQGVIYNVVTGQTRKESKYSAIRLFYAQILLPVCYY